MAIATCIKFKQSLKYESTLYSLTEIDSILKMLSQKRRPVMSSKQTLKFLKLVICVLGSTYANYVMADEATARVGQTVTITVTANGTQPFTYQWRKAGAPIAGATNVNYVMSAVTMSDAGTYSVTVSNSAGSALSNNAVLTVKGRSKLAPPTGLKVSSYRVIGENAAKGTVTVEATYVDALGIPQTEIRSNIGIDDLPIVITNEGTTHFPRMVGDFYELT